MEFEGFTFDRNQFLSVPGLNESTEVLAVLKYSPNTVVGANKPFALKRKKQLKGHKKFNIKDKEREQQYFKESFSGNQYDQCSNLQIVYDNDDINNEDKDENQILNIGRNIREKRWFFIGGDLYLNLDGFTNEGQKSKENYSHWNEWRPHSNIECCKSFIQLNMRTDNEAPYQFDYVIHYLKSMQLKESFQVSQMLQQYSLHVKNEREMYKNIIEYCNNHLEHLQECLAENYNKSVIKAHEILKSIDKSFPFVYFIRRNNYMSLRAQVASIGFNYSFTEILCENRDQYLQSLQRNGFKEVFSNYAHYKLLMMNLLMQNEADIEIVTVDDIFIPCKVRAHSHDLTTFTLTKDTSFTNTLRIYQFEIDEYQIKRIANIRAQRPLKYEREGCDFQYNFNCDQFLRQYNHYFAYHNNSTHKQQNTSQLNLDISNKQQEQQQQQQKQCEIQDTTASSSVSTFISLNPTVNSPNPNVISPNQTIISSNSTVNSSNPTVISSGQTTQNNLLRFQENGEMLLMNQNMGTINKSQEDILRDQIKLQSQAVTFQNVNQPNNSQMSILQSQCAPINQQQLASPHIHGQNQQQLINNSNPISSNFIQPINDYLSITANPLSLQYQQQQLLEILNAYQTNNISIQDQVLNQIQPNPQQMFIQSNNFSNTNMNINGINNNYNLIQNQFGIDQKNNEQQQTMIQLKQMLDEQLEIEKQMQQKQEVEQMHQLYINLTKEQKQNTQLYLQLKQIAIASQFNQQQIPTLYNIQIQFIDKFEKNQQLLHYLQQQISSKTLTL